MAKSELIIAINQLCAERGLDPESVLKAIEEALVSAYKKKYGAGENVFAKIDTKTGDMRIYAELEVVDQVRDRRTQISLENARRYKPDAKVGDRIVIETTPRDFSRIAAQAAKQVMMQRIREAERRTIEEELNKMVGEVVQGTIQRFERREGNIIVNLGRGEGVLPRSEQIHRERYRQNDRLYFYVLSVEKGPRGPYAKLSRTHPNFVRRLLEQEVPEIRTGAVEIKAIAREAGARSKVAVAAVQPGVDPVGSCVGVRGTRIQAVVNALGGEKIDVIEWSPDPYKFIANALSPAKVTDVILKHEDGERRALVIVPENQLSLAIGREGQNARLAAKLTGWHIDIKSEKDALEAGLDSEERQRLRMVYAQEEADLLAKAEELLKSGLLDKAATEVAAESEANEEGAAEEAPEAEPVPAAAANPENEAESSPSADEGEPVPEKAEAAEGEAAEGAEEGEASEDAYMDPEYLDQLAMQQLGLERDEAASSGKPSREERRKRM